MGRDTVHPKVGSSRCLARRTRRLGLRITRRVADQVSKRDREEDSLRLRNRKRKKKILGFSAESKVCETTLWLRLLDRLKNDLDSQLDARLDGRRIEVKEAGKVADLHLDLEARGESQEGVINLAVAEVPNRDLILGVDQARITRNRR